MAGLFDDEKQADMYADARPNYPKEWFSKLAALTPRHCLAWDVATGNGQAALGAVEHYKQVIATDVSKVQLERATPHPRILYLHTPTTAKDDELASFIGGENSVDLITVAQAVHWLDLPKFYPLAARLLRKPGGVLAVWCYKSPAAVNPAFDAALEAFFDTTLPYWERNADHVFDEYKSLPFPFESVGLGSEGNPLAMDIPKEVSFRGISRWLGSWSAVVTAKRQGVDLLSDEVIKGLESAWGGSKLVRTVAFKAFMLAGKVKI